MDGESGELTDGAHMMADDMHDAQLAVLGYGITLGKMFTHVPLHL